MAQGRKADEQVDRIGFLLPRLMNILLGCSAMNLALCMILGKLLPPSGPQFSQV